MITFPSPNASALGVYGNIGVSAYNGVPQTNIPLIEITSPGYTSSIDLTYNSGGVKVNQIASWVGTNWTLKAGGIITRIVRGLPDDLSNGYSDYIGNPIPASYTGEYTGLGGIDNFLTFGYGGKDSEPDEFYFNFGNYSGKFVIDQQGAFFPIPYQNLKFESVGFASFTITDAAGIKYYFNEKEQSISYSECGYGCNSVGQQTVSAWYLSSITTPLNRNITFEYENYQSVKYATGTQELIYYPPKPEQGLRTTYSQVVQGKRLKRIVYENGIVELITASNRCDLPGDRPLKNIILKNVENVIVQKYELDYLYMYGSAGNNWLEETAPCGDALLSRLFLSKISEVNVADPTKKKGPYSFSYFPGLPSRLSFAQDHWGYYNFNPAGTLLPSNYFTSEAGAIYHEGAYREPDINRAKNGTLSRIIFPTGAEQEFEYELNDVTSSTTGLGANFINASTSMNSILHDVNPLALSIPYSAFVRIKLSGSGYSAANPSQWPVKFTIRNSSNSVVYSTLSSASLQDVYINNLASGQYTIQYEVLNPSIPLGISGNYYGIDIIRKETLPSVNGIKVGGLRIRKIITTNPSAGSGEPARQFVRVFEYKDENGMSTGRIGFIPDYSPYQYAESTPTGPVSVNMISHSVLSSTPAYVLENTAGGIVGYKKVTEYYSDYNPYNEYGQNGKTEYYYTTTEDYPDDYLNIVNPQNGNSSYLDSRIIKFPFSPPSSRDWKRGKLIRQIDYKKISTNNFQPVKKIENEYNFVQVGQLRPLKVAITNRFPTGHEYRTGFWYNYYIIGSGYTTVKKTITTDYAGTAPVLKTVNYSYNADLLPVSITELASNTSKQTLKRYPKDFTGNPVYEKMVSSHRISQVIKEITSQNGQSESTYTHHNFWESDSWGNPASSFVLPQYIETAVNQATPEIRIRYHSYDENGNIHTQSRENDLRESYIWGYNKNYPIAKISNADISQVAYTSFETAEAGSFNITDATRNLMFSKTGKKSYVLSPGSTISRHGLPTGTKYIVSYWSKNGSVNVNNTSVIEKVSIDGWTLWEHILSATTQSVSISGNGQIIDELRLYPENSQIITYTFDPLIGMTGMCNPLNKITYYEYDGFGRLSTVRNEEKFILKRFCYNYWGQTAVCDLP